MHSTTTLLPLTPSEPVLPTPAAAGAVYKYDLSLPLGDMYSLVDVMRSRLAAFADVQVSSCRQAQQHAH
jgi:hypothetical protein